MNKLFIGFLMVTSSLIAFADDTPYLICYPTSFEDGYTRTSNDDGFYIKTISSNKFEILVLQDGKLIIAEEVNCYEDSKRDYNFICNGFIKNLGDLNRHRIDFDIGVDQLLDVAISNLHSEGYYSCPISLDEKDFLEELEDFTKDVASKKVLEIFTNL